MLTGLLSPTSENVKVLGWDEVKERENILREVGSLIESPVFYEHLSPTENLKLHLDYMSKKGYGVETALTMVGVIVNGTDTQEIDQTKRSGAGLCWHEVFALW